MNIKPPALPGIALALASPGVGKNTYSTRCFTFLTCNLSLSAIFTAYSHMLNMLCSAYLQLGGVIRCRELDETGLSENVAITIKITIRFSICIFKSPSSTTTAITTCMRNSTDTGFEIIQAVVIGFLYFFLLLYNFVTKKELTWKQGTFDNWHKDQKRGMA